SSSSATKDSRRSPFTRTASIRAGSNGETSIVAPVRLSDIFVRVRRLALFLERAMDKNTGARVSTELTNAPAALHEVEGGARRVLVLVAIPILAAIYCGIALVAQPEADAFVLLWILICALLLAVPLVLERRLDPFSPAFFFVFLRVQWVGKPCLETLFGSYSNRYLENLTQLETFELLRGALVIVALGLFGYWVGYYGGV